MSAGECQTKNRGDYDKEDDGKPIVALDEGENCTVSLQDT